MKTKKTLLFALAFILTSITIITSCKGFDEITEDFDIVVNNAVFNQQIMVELFDPVDQNNLEANNILKVEVLGRDADKILTDAGEIVSSAKFSGGAIALTVNPNKNTTNEPVQFVLKITADNYLTTTIPVFLSDTDSIATLSANLINKLNTPKGIDYIKNTEKLNNNTLSNDVSIETSGVKAVTKTEVTIKAGTIFQDSNGNAISGSEITSEIINFSSNDPDALASFPGGFLPQQVTEENGEIIEDAYFETAGFVSIDMKIGNTEVKNFSEPIAVKMQIASDYLNPETGVQIKAGDVIPVWSYSNDDGKWDYHTTGTVEKDTNDNFVISYTTTHLSSYNLDFYGRRCNNTGWRFTNGRWNYLGNTEITINMPGVNRNSSYTLFSDFVYADTNRPVSYSSGKSKAWFDGQEFQLLNAPGGRLLQMIVYSGKSRYRKGNLIYRSQPFDPCSGNITIDASTIASQLPPPPVNVNIKYRGICGSKIIEPTIPLYMKDPTYGYWRYIGYVWRGRITIRGIELNKEYEFRTYYNGNFFYQNVTFDKTEYVNDSYEIPADLCSRLF